MSKSDSATPLDILRDLWRLLHARERRELLRLQLVTLLMAATTALGLAAIIPLFTILADSRQVTGPGLLGGLYRLLHFTDTSRFTVFLGCGFVLAVMLANAVNYFGARALHRFALRLGRDFHVALFDLYLRRDYLFHSRHGSVTLSNNITYETARVVTGIVQGWLTLVANLCAGAVIVISIVLLDARLAAAAIVLLAGSYALIYSLVRRRLARNGQREGELWDSRARTLTEGFGAIREILLRGEQRHFGDAFARDCDALTEIGLSTYSMAMAPRHALECVLVAGLVLLALWRGGAHADAHWLATLSFLSFAAYRLLPALQQAFAALARLRADRAAFVRIAADLQQARDLPPHAAGAVAGAAVPFAGAPRRAIRVRNVSFRYGAGERHAVRDVSFEIPSGAIVGFVGANGSGKTTMADLLLGLLTPVQGRIDVDGVVLGGDNLPAWRRQVSSVPQSIYLLDASLAQNIAFGSGSDRLDAARLRAAACAAGLETLIASLPEGVETRVGERGARLSGGQRQQVGIARALYRQSSLLVLDEATAALDGIAENEFTAMLAGLRGRLTVIAVTHRMLSARACDCIYEFEDGAIANSGSFEVLMRQSLRFRRLAGAGS